MKELGQITLEGGEYFIGNPYAVNGKGYLVKVQLPAGVYNVYARHSFIPGLYSALLIRKAGSSSRLRYISKKSTSMHFGLWKSQKPKDITRLALFEDMAVAAFDKSWITILQAEDAILMHTNYANHLIVPDSANEDTIPV